MMQKEDSVEYQMILRATMHEPDRGNPAKGERHHGKTC